MSDIIDIPALLRAGRLADVREAMASRVRAEPANPAYRLDLAELLIVIGEYEKADNHVDLVSTQDPSRAMQSALTRQLLRGAIWRGESFEQRRPPELVTQPDAAVTAALARLAGLENDGAPPAEITGTIDGEPFAGLRDLDDRTAGVLEVLTSTGKYIWVPLSAIVALRPRTPEQLRDLVWRPAELEVADGPTGVVYLPAIYHAAAAEMNDELRLGRATDWVEEGGATRGLGLRCWLAGDDLKALGDFAELTVAR
jgi:type VI secretion system protein ImpE